MSVITRFALATALLVLGLQVRAALTDGWPWLILNLVLAWIPLVLGRLAAQNRGFLYGFGPLWLLFLPNAPYLMTDLVHLRARAGVPLWFDVAILGGAGALGVAIGVRSLFDVAGAVRREHGPWAARALLLAMPPLTGLAIHIGRFSRWNSWEVFSHPAGLARDVLPLLLDPITHPTEWAFIATYAALFRAAALVGAPWPDRALCAGADGRILGGQPEPQ